MMTLPCARNIRGKKPGLACGYFCMRVRSISIDARYSFLVTAIR